MYAAWKLLPLLMSLSMFFAKPIASMAGQCPDGWISFRDSCYLLANHILLDWTGSTQYCTVHHGARLVSIESATEQIFLVDKCKALSGDSALYWTGGSDDDIEGIWQWYPGNRDMSYTAWGPGEPNNHHEPENCLVLAGYKTYMWNDESCTHYAHPLCELSLVGVVIGK